MLINQKNLARDPRTNFWIRLNFESILSITFRIFVIISKYIHKFNKKNIIYYSHENSLLKGSVAYFIFKGFILKKLSISNNIIPKNNQNIKLIAEKKVFKKFVKSILGNNSYKKINSFLINEFNNEISKYYYYKKEAKKIIDDNVKALLIGTPTSISEIASIEISNSRKIVTASFQHGISKEISKDISCITTMFETNIINLYFVYNQTILRTLLKNKFNVSENFNVGLPVDMKSSISKKILNNYRGEILYASTNLYCGNRGIPSRSGASDFDKATFELDLINSIFKKIPKKVHFKPYFSKRYTGQNIELEAVKKSKNIKLIKDEIDLRYLLRYYKIIITSRATSTIGWCLLSKKPLIYIETIDNRLNKESYNAFKKNLFFFDIKDKYWKRDLKNLLSKPILEIENIWKSNAIQRKNFVRRFFGDITSNAEYKCAKILFEKIN